MKLKDLGLSRTWLDGYLPDEVGNLQSLQRAHFELSYFKGKIPNDLCDISTLKELTADCSGTKKVKCYCCTMCCNRRNKTCVLPTEKSKKPDIEYNT